MFKFVEHKAFFYLSALISLFWVFFGIKFSGGSYQVVLQLTLTGVLIVAMMIFYNRDNKELMKTLLAAYITVIFLSSVLESIDVIFNFPLRFHQYNLRFMQDPIRIFISSINIIAFPLLMFLLFINHFIINFNGKESKLFINFNKIIVVIMVVCVIVDKCSVYIVNMLNNNEIIITVSELKIAVILRYFHLLCSALTIVSAEAFINTQRAQKTNKK